MYVRKVYKAFVVVILVTNFKRKESKQRIHVNKNKIHSLCMITNIHCKQNLVFIMDLVISLLLQQHH